MIKLNAKEIITKLENSKTPLYYSIFTFFFVSTLRCFLETFSDIDGRISFYLFAHYYLFYIALALALMVLLCYGARERIGKVARIVLPSFLVLIVVPLSDLLFSWGRGYDIAYLRPPIHRNLLLRFFTFFGSFNGIGITPGMRIEIGLAVLGSFIYFMIKRRDIVKSLILAFLTYSIIFTFLITPFILKVLLDLFDLALVESQILIINFNLALSLIFCVWLFYLHCKKYLIEIIKDIRPFRLLHFELMFVLGVVLARTLSVSPAKLTHETLFYWPFIPISIMFAWLFSVVTNNITDYEIDQVTNKTRPLVSGKIPLEHYKYISWALLASAILFAWAVSFRILFLILLFIGNYFIYSMPPLRLKRIPFFSKLVIALNSLILMMLGYGFVTESTNLPGKIILLLLVGFTAAINFIDIKDYEGDKKEGIRTLPTIFGLKNSKMIISAFFLISHIAVYFILQSSSLLVPLLLLGLVQVYLINRENYDEKPVFITHLTTLVIVIAYIASV